MHNKLTQEQIDHRLKIYDECIDRMMLVVYGNREGHSEQAAAVVKELRGARKRFIKRMEGGRIGRKAR